MSLALAGEKKEALRVIRELQGISGKRYVSPYGVAQIYAALNDKEQTYNWLEAAYRDRAVWMSYLAVDPVFDSIRSEDRFRGLLRRAGLPTAEKQFALLNTMMRIERRASALRAPNRN